MTLIQFLLARITEDEEVANNAICGCGGPACTVNNGWYDHSEAEARLEEDGPARHVVRFSPSRVLAECKAKREIVATAVGYGAEYPDFEGGYQTGYEEAAGDLAEVYSDHPDFDPVWKV
jgi:hypothetical protein